MPSYAFITDGTLTLDDARVFFVATTDVANELLQLMKHPAIASLYHDNYHDF